MLPQAIAEMQAMGTYQGPNVIDTPFKLFSAIGVPVGAFFLVKHGDKLQEGLKAFAIAKADKIAEGIRAKEIEALQNQYKPVREGLENTVDAAEKGARPAG